MDVLSIPSASPVPLSLKPSDNEIWRAFVKYQYLTVELAAQVLHRDFEYVQKRFHRMHETKYLNRVQASLLQPYVYFLGKLGAEEAERLGYLEKARWITQKSPMTVVHDLEITTFHLLLETALNGKPEIVEWVQWRDDLKVKIQDGADMFALIPDAKFKIGDDKFCLEVVKSRQSEYKNGKSNIEQKLSLYRAYHSGIVHRGPDFRVLWILPTKERVLNLLAKIEDEFPIWRFWFTYEEAYREDILGKVWWTPKNFRDRCYSLFEVHN